MKGLNTRYTAKQVGRLVVREESVPDSHQAHWLYWVRGAYLHHPPTSTTIKIASLPAHEALAPPATTAMMTETM